MNIKLRFEDYTAGFLLEDPQVEDVDSLEEFEELEQYYFEASTGIDEAGRIRYFDFELWKSPAQLEGLIKNPLISQIPGLYTVPELGVRNATFKEVLEAVKKYYETKLSQHSVQTA
jgi:hypothetical protein